MKQAAGPSRCQLVRFAQRCPFGVGARSVYLSDALLMRKAWLGFWCALACIYSIVCI
jgi:hypothetical protein